MIRATLALGCLTLAAACGSSDNLVNPPPPPDLTGPATVTVAPSTPSVAVGQTVQLIAVVRDSNGTVIPGATVVWSVADQAKASITGSGVVTGGAPGSTMITASSGPASEGIPLTVTQTAPPGTLHLSYATYFGGIGDDMARDVVVDAQGNTYVGGSTQSSDFPRTTGPAFNGGGAFNSDAFVAKFGPTGNLIWSRLVGGPNYERAYAIELGPQGEVYIAGRAGAGFPVTAGAFQTAFAGGIDDPGYGAQDGFVCKLKADGSAVTWCSYFGVDDGRIIRDIAVDHNGDVYISSATNNGGFETLHPAWFTNAPQKTKIPGPLTDLIVAKVKSDGSQVLWATYIGGTGDEGNSPSIRVDAQGYATVVTGTSSTDMPTVNAAQPNNGGGTDFFIARVAPNGASLVFATYLGGSGIELTETHGVAIDAQGNATVGGQTNSPNFPVTSGAVQPNFGGGLQDGFVARYSTTGAKLAATYLGGSGTEGIQGVGVDAQGHVFVSGLATGTFPATTAVLGPLGGSDFTATELSSTLDSLMFSARIAGSADESSRSSAIDANGGFHLVGHTVSTDMYHLNAVQPSNGGAMDAVVMEFVP